MSEKRIKARARALRAAQVVTIAGAMLGVGCGMSHELPQDAMVMDAELADGRIVTPDADLPDDRVPDANVPDGDTTCPPDVACNCVQTTEACCASLNETIPAFYTPNQEGDPTMGECCGVCVGPLVPPELMV